MIQLATLCYVKDVERRRTLMLHRVTRKDDMHAGKWNGLGGKFEAGETPEACVIREIKEESGLDIRNPQLVGFLTFPLFKGDEDWYVFVYVATDFSGTVVSGHEGNLAWIEDDELLSLNLWEGDPTFLNWIAEGTFFSASFRYVDGELKGHDATLYPALSGDGGMPIGYPANQNAGAGSD